MMLGTADSDVWVESVKGLSLSSASVVTLNGHLWKFWSPAANAGGAGGACLVATVGSYQIRVCDPGDTSRNALKSLRPIASELTISDSPKTADWYPKRQALGLGDAVSRTTSSTSPAASRHEDLPSAVAGLADRVPFILNRPAGWNLWSGTKTLGDQWPISLGLLHDPDNRLTENNIGDFPAKITITLSTAGTDDIYDRATSTPLTISGRAWWSLFTKKSGDAPVRCMITSVGADILGICYVNATQNDSGEDLFSFVNRITVAPSADPSTWYPKVKALG